MALPHHSRLQNIKETFNAHSALWIALLGGAMLTGATTMAHMDQNWNIDESYHIVFALSTNCLLLFIVLIYIFAILKSHLSSLMKFTLAFGGALVITGTLSIFIGWLQRLIYENTIFYDRKSISLIRDMIVGSVAILISLLLYNLARRQQLNLEKEKLQTENLMVRYEALENQLDPHFLFNSLNTLSGLIGNDDENAQKYLQRLASTYRYIMQGKRLVSLEDELDFVDSYCQMMQIRYGNNLIIDKQIDNTYLKHQILPISIQLLIENALKHNVVSDRHHLTINIVTTPQGNIRVSNLIHSKQEPSNGTGVGLANLSKRCQLFCQKDIVITKTDNNFSVEVPLLDPAQAAKRLSKMQITEARLNTHSHGSTDNRR